MTPAMDVVSDVMNRYAMRGLLRDFAERRPSPERGEFVFDWNGRKRLRVTVDTSEGALAAHDVLHDVPAGSPVHAAVRDFVRSRCADDVPEHRRIDVGQVGVRVSSRRNNVSIAFRLRNAEYEYAARKLINLLHELFVHLETYQPEYLHAAFGAPQE